MIVNTRNGSGFADCTHSRGYSCVVARVEGTKSEWMVILLQNPFALAHLGWLSLPEVLCAQYQNQRETRSWCNVRQMD